MRVDEVLRRLGIDYDRRRTELWAKCPAHKDKSPSWSINGRSGKHNCFSCGFGGTIEQLVAHVLRVTLEDAERWLKENGGPAREEKGAPAPTALVVSRPGRVNLLPQEVEAVPFERWPSSVRAYVVERGVTPEQVERWGIGYAIFGRLAGRIVIPVRDVRGRLLTYMARDFSGDPKAKRYLYPQGRWEGMDGALFGEQRWNDADRTVVVTEGAIDALAVERALPQFGLAAIGGSELRPAQALKLRLRFGTVVVLTDNDEAGSKAAQGFKGALAGQCEVVRAKLPEGKDAASVEPADVFTCVKQALELKLPIE